MRLYQVHYLIQFFENKHLPDTLRPTAQIFKDLALGLDAILPENPEKTTALRKLLEAKDCAVRSHLFKGNT
jgi:hypothetical protein